MSTEGAATMKHYSTACIGFGTAGLSLAISLLESDSAQDIIFLEQQAKVSWQPLDDTPNRNHTTSNFLNDLVTFENPRSTFTFINFLHARKLLVDFTNVGHTTTSRQLFGQYLKWCADRFDEHVHYSTRVVDIKPVKAPHTQKVGCWEIESMNMENGTKSTMTADRVVLACGEQPYYPQNLRTATVQASVVHSSMSRQPLAQLATTVEREANVAIIGDGQQAAEIFEYLYMPHNKVRVTWFPQGGASEQQRPNQRYAPEEDSRLPFELQSASFTGNSIVPSGLGEISEHLLESIQEHQYAQSVKQPDKSQWRFKIEPNKVIGSAERTVTGRVRLVCSDQTLTNCPTEEFDMIISATGFERSEHRRLLRSSGGLLDSDDPTIDARYRVNMRHKSMMPGRSVWAVGTLDVPEATGDLVFPIIAARSKRVADSIREAQHAQREDELKQGSDRLQAQI